ncbi:MAG TPA: peptide-methionine (S)-S-oxide reductase MsrA [Anaerolineales bacterium]
MGINLQVATLAGGCFWCLEAVYDELKGVESVESGYSGGQVANPTYEQVCEGNSGHVEAVRITFDPSIITYRDLLKVFFSIHDPTSLNRQGADSGPQYRSAIFYHDDEQKATAAQVIREFTEAGLWADPIVTEVVAFDKFYMAEDYHQEYFKKNPFQGYCRAVIAPKVIKFRQKFVDILKK